MKPVRTARSNMVYLGPDPSVGDAWAEATATAAYLVWELSDEDREAIALGANLRLGVYQHPMPPVSLDVTVERALSPAGARWHERARRCLRSLSSGPLDIPAGYWIVSPDALVSLSEAGALDTEGVPKLLGRPLMEVDSFPVDTIEYVATGPEQEPKVRGRYA